MKNNLIGKKAKPHPAFCRAKCTIGNKKGFSYVLTCVFILVVMMLVSVFIQYAQIYHIGINAKKEAKLKIDSYITACAIENYNALKQGVPYAMYISEPQLVSGAETVLEYINDHELYEATTPQVTALSNRSFGVKVGYMITIPFVVFDQPIANISIPIDFESQYKEK